MKYHNRKIVLDGIRFDSAKEARRWTELKLLERAGEISNLQRQVKFEVIPKCGKERSVTYIADFVYQEKGNTVVEDVKGVRTKEYILKRKLMNWVHDIQIKEI
jgi:hypothetical protein|nr:MAG TPA: Endonuclease [Caudoviricetes sp.]